MSPGSSTLCFLRGGNLLCKSHRFNHRTPQSLASQQIKGFNPSNSSHHIAKNTENIILKLLKLVLRRTDLEQMLETKKRCTLSLLTPLQWYIIAIV
jgi:hypothetical protein